MIKRLLAFTDKVRKVTMSTYTTLSQRVRKMKMSQRSLERKIELNKAYYLPLQLGVDGSILQPVPSGCVVDIPKIDPSGCDVIIWNLNGEIYGVDVINGQVYWVLDLARLLELLPDTWTLGIVMPTGLLSRVYGKNTLQ